MILQKNKNISTCDRHTWRSGVRSAMHAATSYLEGGPLMWMLPLNLHVNQKSDDDDDNVTPLHTFILMLSMLGKYFSRWHFEIHLFFQETRLWHFMQIVSSGDNLHEMSKPGFCEKQETANKQCLLDTPKDHNVTDGQTRGTDLLQMDKMKTRVGSGLNNKNIINLSSAELALRVVLVKTNSLRQYLVVYPYHCLSDEIFQHLFCL